MAPRQPTMTTQHLLPHERLDVFHVAIELNQLVATICLPRGQAELRDQLRRAVSSIALNIGEGASKGGPDGRRYFGIARGSCGEVAATLRVLLAIGAINEASHCEGREMCGRIHAMLNGLCGHRRLG